jgi:hypothetical protein
VPIIMQNSTNYCSIWCQLSCKTVLIIAQYGANYGPKQVYI